MTQSLNERAKLEESYGTLLDALKVENDQAKREQLLLELDEVVGERLAHEMEHAEEFRAYDKQFVAA